MNWRPNALLAATKKFLPRAALPQLGLLVVVITIIWASILLHLKQERQQYEDAAWQEVNSLAHGYEQSIGSTIEGVDQVMLLIRALYRADPQHFDLAAMNQIGSQQTDLALQVTITNASGVMLGSNLAPQSNVDLSDREHVRVHMNSTNDFLFISKPVLGRVSHKWSIQFTRKLFNLKDEFVGVLVVSVNPSYFASFYNGLQGLNGAIALVGLDGVYRVRAPEREGTIGAAVKPDRLERLKFGDGDGSFREVSQIDGVDRLISFRRLNPYPLAVLVGISAESAFARYNEDRLPYIAIGICLTVLVLVLSVLLIEQGQRLLLSQMTLVATLDNVDQGVAMVDSNGIVPVINRRAVQLLALPPHLAREGVNARDILDWQIANGEFKAASVTEPESDKMLSTDLNETYRTGIVGPSFYERTRRDGRILEVRTQQLEDGGSVRTFTDITHRKRNEATLQAALTAAETARRAQSDFLAVMSHEIRTPLNGVIGMAGLLIDSELSSKQRSFATTLREAANSLMQIINDILDYSKLEAHKMEFEEIPFELPHLVRSVVDLMAVKAHERNLTLRADIVPSAPRHLIGDPGRIRQILLNLVSNAVKFTVTGGVSIEVDGERSGENQALVRITVRDTGIGISAAAQERLFEQFFQVDSSNTRGFGGTGLGLAICQRIAMDMGGRLTVASELGKGSAFQVELSLSVDPEPLLAVTDDKAPGPERWLNPRPKRRLRILLAEDNATNRMVAVTRLEMAGHRIDQVANGLEAVQMVQTAPYDVVLMDVMMPQLDGFGATRAIRALDGSMRSIPIIAMTANVFSHHQDACREAGMNDFLGKPFTPAQLERVLDRVITVQAPSATNASTDPDIAEETALARLIDSFGKDEALNLFKSFTAEALANAETIRAHDSAGNWSQRTTEAQALADTAGSLGLTGLEVQASRIASLPAAKSAPELLDGLETSLHRLIDLHSKQYTNSGAA